jgi:phage-related protein
VKMTSSLPWIFYTSERGRPVVQQEIEKLKLDRYELAVFERVLRRLETQEHYWQDSKHLGRDIWEARIRLPHRQVRVLYSMELKERIHLGLLAAVKKSQKVPSQWISLAVTRRRSWRERMDNRD